MESPSAPVDPTVRRFPRLKLSARGQSLVELALLLPILLLLLAGTIDLGRVWYSQITITNAAREGALEAAVEPTSYAAGQPCNKTTNRIMCRAINETSGGWITVTPADVTMTCSPSCDPGTPAAPHTAVVEVRGHFSLLTPLMAIFTGATDITLKASVSATIAMSPALAPVGTSAPTPSPSPTPSATPSPTPTGSASGTPSPSPTATPTPTPAPCYAPVADFSVSPTSGKKKKQTFTFTDASTNMNNAACNPVWSWNFGDGSGASSAQNPTYVWNSSGTYTVTLVASNSAGSSTKTKTVNVTN
jgi:PKD repeat protein